MVVIFCRLVLNESMMCMIKKYNDDGMIGYRYPEGK